MEYEDIIVVEKLKRLNNGFNFFNFVQTKKKYCIDVELFTTQNLKEKKEKISVSHNLDLGSYRWDSDVETFLKELDDFCKKPLAQVRVSKIREKDYSGRYIYRTYSHSEIQNETRDKTIKFSDIEIEIKNLAKQKLKEKKIDFEGEVKKSLAKQKDIEKEVQEKIDRYIILKEKIIILKNLIEKDSGYYYSRPKDNSIKITLSPIEYNSKLKEIEVELRELEKFFGMREERLDYLKIEEELTYEEWFEQNEEKLRENYENAQEESGETETTFNEYAELIFENGGLNEEDEEDYDEEYEEEIEEE